ncbi:MAG: hypothetical protein ACK5BE_05890 [Alphaproteobacteria bacterium]|jgi:hypothetical protein
MFNPNFKRNTNFEEGSTTDIVYDARSILTSIDYIFLRTAIDTYRFIQTRDNNNPDVRIDTLAWKALKLIAERNGNFKEFRISEKHLLQAIESMPLVYDEILRVLIEKHSSIGIVEEIVKLQPEILDYLPDQYNKKEFVLEVMVEVIHDYQWQLKRFYEKHHEVINKAIRDL